MRLKNETYDILKWIAIIVLPALATLYAGLAQIWHFPFEVEIPATIMAIDTFLGILIGVSTNTYNKEQLTPFGDEGMEDTDGETD